MGKEGGTKEHNHREDEACDACLRNPADFVATDEEFSKTIADVAHIIRHAVRSDPQWKNLSSVCGNPPSMFPPPHRTRVWLVFRF